MKINTATATLIGAAFTLIGVVVASGLAQWGAAKLEDQRARTEIVLELMRTNDREKTLQKLRILDASGLLPDKDGRLISAVTKAPNVVFRIERVKIPVAVRCVRPEDIPAVLPPLGERPEGTGQAARKLAFRANYRIKMI